MPPRGARRVRARSVVRVTVGGLLTMALGVLSPPLAAAPVGVPSVSPEAAPGSLLPVPGQERSDTDQERARRLFVQALEMARGGRLQQALETALQGAELAPDDADGQNLLGQIHEGLGHTEAAREAYRRALESDPEYLQPAVSLVVLELRAERYAAALEAVDVALRLDASDPRLHAFRGVALRNLRRLDESLAAFERAWELDPDSGDLALDVSVARGLTGDRSGAVAAAERAVVLAPESLPARLNLARLLANGQTEAELVRAPGAYRDALELAPEIADVWLRLAECYSRLAMHGEAEGALRKAREMGASGVEVEMALGEALHAQGEYEEAAETFGRAAELVPDLGMAHFLRSEALMNLDRTDEALEELDRAAEAMPGDPRPHLAAARILLGRGELEEVERQLQAALATGRDAGQTQLAMGRLRQRQGRIDEAVEAIRNALAVDPDLLEARYLLGQLLVQAGQAEEGREVLADYQQRLNRQRSQEVAAQRANATDRARIHGVRARVYLHEDRPADALAQLEAAVELTPEDPVLWRLLVETHEALGQRAEAERARARLAELEGDRD